MSFINAFQKITQKTGLATANTDDIIAELSSRTAAPNPFPLHVFHPDIKPFLDALHTKYNVPRCYIGLCLLGAYSSAIGTAYTVSTNDVDHFFMSVWGCLWGLSSSGKSLCMSKIYSELYRLQNNLDLEWKDSNRGTTHEQMARKEMKTIIYRDVHVPTLTRNVLPVNPKGLTKIADELMEWINGMNQLSKKEGTDEQFWISTWNCHSYSGIRSGNQKFFTQRPFVNVIGGTQNEMISRLLGRDRDTTGFIFRLLFAKDYDEFMADVDPFFQMPQEWECRHNDSIRAMYDLLPVDNFEDPPRRTILTHEATKHYYQWVRENIRRINLIVDKGERNIHAGIFGKIKEYALRFAGILAVSDKAIEITNGNMRNPHFPTVIGIDTTIIERSILLANYFYNTAWEAYQHSRTSITAPHDVVVAAKLFTLGKSNRVIAEFLYRNADAASIKRVERQIKKWLVEYPRLFNSKIN